MWYIIPDLDNLKLFREDLDAFYAYYKYINEDIELMKNKISQYVGQDVANIVMEYTPDYISIYEEKFDEWPLAFHL